MRTTSSISPGHRARLRRLKADFDAAYRAVDDPADRTGTAHRAADLHYRAWVKALDEVAIALLDDIDAFEADDTAAKRAHPIGERAADPLPPDVGPIFAGIADLQQDIELIGVAKPSPARTARPTPRSRAMNVIGQDRVDRHWNP